MMTVLSFTAWESGSGVTNRLAAKHSGKQADELLHYCSCTRSLTTTLHCAASVYHSVSRGQGSETSLVLVVRLRVVWANKLEVFS